MNLISFTITVTLTFISPEDWRLTVNPTWLVNAPVVEYLPAAGLALPHVAFLDLDYVPRTMLPYFVREEMIHTEQWSSLGPNFLIAYVSTLGRPFEPYDPVYSLLGIEREGYNLDNMWVPPREMVNNCPLILLTPRYISFLPCYIIR